MKKALGEAPGKQTVGVNPKDDVKLSPEQRKSMKDAIVNPGVNHDNQWKKIDQAVRERIIQGLVDKAQKEKAERIGNSAIIFGQPAQGVKPPKPNAAQEAK